MLAEGEHALVLTRGCPEKRYTVVVGAGAAEAGDLVVETGMATVLPIAVAPPEPLMTTIAFEQAGLRDGEQLRVGSGPVEADFGALVTDGKLRTRVDQACGLHDVGFRMVVTKTGAPRVLAGSSTLDVRPDGVTATPVLLLPEPFGDACEEARVKVYNCLHRGWSVEAADYYGSRLTPANCSRFLGEIDWSTCTPTEPESARSAGAQLGGALIARRSGPEPCDGGALPTGGPTGHITEVDLPGFDPVMRFTHLSGGGFAMGSGPAEEGRLQDERCRRVTVAPFALATTEVSQSQWTAVMGEDPSAAAYQGVSLRGITFPVQAVSWCDAVRFANALSEKTGRTKAYADAEQCEEWGVRWVTTATGFLLPTEAQWEYAARAGTADVYVGTSDPSEICSYSLVADASTKTKFSAWETVACDDERVGPGPVLAKTPNHWGLFQMGGNVREWVWDPYSGGAGTGGASLHVARGGSWFGSPETLRIAYRAPGEASSRTAYVGLRLALPLPAPTRQEPDPFDPAMPP